MRSPRGMAKKLRSFADDVPAQLNEIKKIAAQEFLNQVVPDTPRDTGQARANYVTALGEPDRVTTFPGPGNGDASLKRGRAVIQGAKPKQPIFITNNLPYIGLLNNGYSKQAPAGFIQSAAKRTKDIIQRQRVRWKV